MGYNMFFCRKMYYYYSTAYTQTHTHINLRLYHFRIIQGLKSTMRLFHIRLSQFTYARVFPWGGETNAIYMYIRYTKDSSKRLQRIGKPHLTTRDVCARVRSTTKAMQQQFLCLIHTNTAYVFAIFKYYIFLTKQEHTYICILYVCVKLTKAHIKHTHTYTPSRIWTMCGGRICTIKDNCLPANAVTS